MRPKGKKQQRHANDQLFFETLLDRDKPIQDFSQILKTCEAVNNLRQIIPSQNVKEEDGVDEEGPDWTNASVNEEIHGGVDFQKIDEPTRGFIRDHS